MTSHAGLLAPCGELREHTLEVLRASVDGGLVLATHSVAPDISVGTMEYVRELMLEFGTYPTGWV